MKRQTFRDIREMLRALVLFALFAAVLLFFCAEVKRRDPDMYPWLPDSMVWKDGKRP